MRPRLLEKASEDLFRSRLESIVDRRHGLVRLAALIDWSWFCAAFCVLHHECKGRPALPIRRSAGLQLLKHMKALSDKKVCAALPGSRATSLLR